jgi:DNA gyrase/topoisomerase IV subunit A
MEEKVYLREKEYPMPVKKIKPTESEHLNEKELEEYLRSVEVLKPWEIIEVNKDAIGVPAFVISGLDAEKLPAGEAGKDRVGTFFNIIQYKFSCDIKNGKLGKTSMANFTTYVKDIYSYSYPAFILEKLKKVNKTQAKAYAEAFKTELQKLYNKKIASDEKELEKYKAETKGTLAESKTALAKIKV